MGGSLAFPVQIDVEVPTWLEKWDKTPERVVGVLQMMQNADRHDEVKAAIQEWELLCVCLHRQYGFREMAACDIDRVA